MKNEDKVIVSLAVIVLIFGAIALLVTGAGISLNKESPVMTSTPIANNTTSSSSNSTDSSTHDTGISISEVSEENRGTSSDSGAYYSDTSYSSYTGDASSSSQDSGSSDSSSEGSESGQAPSEGTVSSLD